MKVTKKSEQNSTIFAEIPTGTVFQYGDGTNWLYLKIRESTEGENVVDLFDFQLDEFHGEQRVTPIYDAELVIP